MTKTSFFQIILLVILGGAFALAVLIFAGVLPGFRAKKAGVEVNLTMWGQIPAGSLDNFLTEINEKANGTYKINYVEKNFATINEDLLEALAVGAGPDLILLPHELIFQNRNKVATIPFASFSERKFQDTFVEAGQIFKTSDGWLALPIALNPLVLYYNKDLYASAGVINPPKSWEEIVAHQPKFTKFDNLQSLNQSAVSFGTSNNVNNFKDILSLLLIQVGILPINLNSGDEYQVGFSSIGEQGESKLGMSLDFYNQFSNPQLSTYTWNRSLPRDIEVFLSGRLANYFGLASELPTISEANPHLNFDVASVPRLNRGANLTVAHVYGLAILKNSQKTSLAFAALSELALSDHKFLDLYRGLGLPSARRSVLAQPQADPKSQVFYREALVCRAWPDPEKNKTSLVFKNLIDDSSAGRLEMRDAVNKAITSLELIINNSK